MSPAAIRVMIVDDHPVVRKGLASFLGHEPDIEVVGMADSGEQALEMAAELHPDVVLMDLSMPGMGGIEATRRLVETCPGTRVMMLTSFGGHERMVEALKSGAVGYVVKDTAPADLLNALRSVASTGKARLLLLDLGDQRCHRGARVAEEHERVRLVEERVVDAGKPGRHAALQDDDGLRLVDVEDRHPVDRAVRLGPRGGVDHVVGADDDSNIGAREIAVDRVHLLELRIGDVRLGEQHVHMPGHASGNRMDRVLDCDAALLELVCELLDLVLRARDSHAVPGDEDDQLRECEQWREVLDGRRMDGAALGAGRTPGGLDVDPKPLKSTLKSERFIALLIASVRIVPDAPTSAPLTMSTSLLSTNPVVGRGKTGEGVEQRDDHRHVGATDRHHEEDAEEQ